MALTLIEAAKLAQTPLQAGVIETIAKNSGVLERLPFLPVSSNAYTYNREQTLPGVAFRAVGENYVESTGVINPVTERLSILGGVSDYDRALVKTQGNVNNLRAVHDAMKAKSEALKFTATFFNGDSEANPKAFDGLKKRLTKGTNSYVTEAEATAYVADRLHADAWTEATEGNRQKALLMACKLLDGHILWTGYKTDDAQALAWPRIGVTGVTMDVVPASVGIAQMELALILLKTDVTARPIRPASSPWRWPGRSSWT